MLGALLLLLLNTVKGFMNACRERPPEDVDGSPVRSGLDARLDDCEAGWLPASGGVVLAVSGLRPRERYNSLECASAGALKPRLRLIRPRSDASGIEATRGTLERPICSPSVDAGLYEDEAGTSATSSSGDVGIDGLLRGFVASA